MRVIFGPRWKHWTARVIAFFAIVGGLAGFTFLVSSYRSFAEDLPELRRLEDYRPPQVSRVFDQAGQTIGELYRERREVVPFHRMPPLLVKAFVASEDDRFFEHDGIDYWGILRAAFANARAGRVVQGGSTITQQVAKSLLISQEGYEAGTARKIGRKVREAILARRLERHLTKADILSLYLNQIFLGNQAYGVQSAAQCYFRKNVDELSVAEMALLAGLPQAPSRYSPFRHPKRARERRRYVLRRMVEEGYLSEADLREAEATPIRVFRAPDLSRSVTPYYTEHVRRELFDTYGTRLLEDGLRIWTAVDAERYHAAADAVYEKLRVVDKRQGYRGPLTTLETAEERTRFLEAYTHELAALGRDGPLRMHGLYLGLIEKIDRSKNLIHVRVGQHSALLPLAAMRWARPVNPQRRYDSALLNRIPRRFSVGDVVHVRVVTRSELRRDDAARPMLREVPKTRTIVQLEQEPNLEAAVLSQAVDTGYVTAMVGGYAFERSEFNRALQACRQPGSSFKPIVYSAALDVAEMNASSIILDAPLTFNDAEAQNRWKPSNFEGRFQGEVTLRTALKDSMNVPSIRVLEKVGVREAIKYARRLGFESRLRPELGLALGASCVTMGEMVRAYGIFAAGGRQLKRRFVTRVEDRDGNVLMDDGAPQDPWAPFGRRLERALRWTDAPPRQVLEPQIAFLITRLMRNVVEDGTGVAAQRVGVPIAGKTGTTNDSFDAWFSGFTTDLITSAWVGFDDYVLPMGRYEQGGRAALPIWVAFMKRAIKKRSSEFVAPEGVVFVSVDEDSGKRVPPESPRAVSEAYLISNQPEEFEASPDTLAPDEFFIHDN
ncbi:MAG: penicillin-binding protein 1A [Myxococcota bacterium]